jgi:hypothetical protein
MPNNKKGHQPVLNPADGLGIFFRMASSGAGYDDQGNNNNAYRDGAGVAEYRPTCEDMGHWQ